MRYYILFFFVILMDNLQAQVMLPAYHGVQATKTVIVDPNVGDSYGGGYVGYILVSGDAGYSATVKHGLIISGTDVSAGIVWFAGTGTAVSTSSVVGDGNTNSINIVGATGSGSCAAKLCLDLSLNGYTDWYLPSYYDLFRVFQAMGFIVAGGMAPPGASAYWTSFNGGSTTTALGITYSSGPVPAAFAQNSARAVRAFRSF